jgi:hypothetical protein
LPPSALVNRATTDCIPLIAVALSVVYETYRCPFVANLGWNAKPRNPPSPDVFTGGSVSTVVLVASTGLDDENDTIVPERSATKKRVESPGICAIAIGVSSVRPANVFWSCTEEATGGRAGATHFVFEGRVS